MEPKKNMLTTAIVGLMGLAVAGSALSATLQDAVQQSLSTNPEVLITTNERLAREQEVAQAKGGYLPTIDLSGGYGTEWSDNATTAVNPGEDVWLARREAAIDLRQMVWDGLATKSEVDRQKARVNSQAYTVQGTSQNTALRTAQVYLELLRQQELLQLAKGNLAAHQRIYDQIKLRSDSGVGRKADLDQIQGRLALAESNVLASENNVREAEANYLRVVGAMPEDLVRPVSVADALPMTVEEAVAIGLEGHPTLKSAGADVGAALAQHEAAKSAYSPRIDIEVGRTWNNNWDGREGDDEDMTAMLRLRWNVFNGFKDVARRKQTAHLINEAKAVMDNTHRQVEESVRLSWTSYQTTKAQLDYLKQHMESSKKTRDAYTKQFNIGQRTLLDVLDTENEVFESSKAYITGDYTNQYAQYRVLNGMGKLLDTLAVAAPEEGKPLGQ